MEINIYFKESEKDLYRKVKKMKDSEIKYYLGIQSNE